MREYQKQIADAYLGILQEAHEKVLTPNQNTTNQKVEEASGQIFEHILKEIEAQRTTLFKDVYDSDEFAKTLDHEDASTYQYDLFHYFQNRVIDRLIKKLEEIMTNSQH